MKIIDIKTSYYINSYLVTLEKLKNDKYGTPRFKAFITDINDAIKNGGSGTWCYKFSGKYLGDQKEAERILNYHLKELSKDE